jgi:hypothetical protein
MFDQQLPRPEPARTDRIVLVFGGIAVGFALGVEVGGRLGPGARFGGVLVYQLAMGVALALLWFNIWTRLRA